MSKQTGLGDELFVDGHDIAGDVQSIGSLSTPIGTLEMTGINKYAFERQYGKRDGTIEFTSFFNTDPGASHAALKDLPRTNGHIMYLHAPGAGGPAVGMVGKRTDYAASRGDDGSLVFGVNAQASGYGIDWCVQVSDGKETHAAATEGVSVDLGTGPAAFGYQAYLQVFSIGSGTADIKLQDSPDDSVWTDLADGAFTAVTGRTAERVQSASDTATVNRYLRVVTTGTFTDLVFCVAVNRNQALRAI